MPIYVARPTVLAKSLLDDCGPLRQLLFNAATPGCFHTLQLYIDEVVPGNILMPNHSRKFSAVYWSFDAWDSVCFMEQAWLPLECVRSSIVKTRARKFSGFFSALLSHLMFGVDGFAEGGLVVDWEGESRLLLANRVQLIADEAAQKTALDYFGASGLRCCVKCSNLVTCSSGIAALQPFFKDFTCTSLSDFVPNEAADLRRMHAELGAMQAHVSTTAFNEQEKARGIHYNALGVLANGRLQGVFDVVQDTLYDPLHVWMSSGLITSEMSSLFYWLRRNHCAVFADIREVFMASAWKSQKQRPNILTAIKTVFHDGRENNFRCDASELISIVPMMKMFFMEEAPPFPSCLLEVQSFLLHADVLIQLLAIKRLPSDAHERRRAMVATLKALVVRHQASFIEAYGSESLRPKDHMKLHCIEQLVHKAYKDCFTCERKNKKAKASATRLTDPKIFERSALALLVEDHRKMMGDVALESALGQPTCATAEFGNGAEVSKTIVLPTMTIHDGDVLVSGNQAALVLAGVWTSADGLCVLVDRLERLRNNAVTSIWRSRRDYCALRVGDWKRWLINASVYICFDLNVHALT